MKGKPKAAKWQRRCTGGVRAAESFVTRRRILFANCSAVDPGAISGIADGCRSFGLLKRTVRRSGRNDPESKNESCSDPSGDRTPDGAFRHGEIGSGCGAEWQRKDRHRNGRPSGAAECSNGCSQEMEVRVLSDRKHRDN